MKVKASSIPGWCSSLLLTAAIYINKYIKTKTKKKLKTK